LGFGVGLCFFLVFFFFFFWFFFFGWVGCGGGGGVFVGVPPPPQKPTTQNPQNQNPPTKTPPPPPPPHPPKPRKTPPPPNSPSLGKPILRSRKESPLYDKHRGPTAGGSCQGRRNSKIGRKRPVSSVSFLLRELHPWRVLLLGRAEARQNCRTSQTTGNRGNKEDYILRTNL